MDAKLFFRYYLPALKQALEEDNVNEDFLVKAPSWFYPLKDIELYHELMRFEDSHYEEFPLLEEVAYYFDARSHNFPDVGDIDIDTCREKIIEEMKQLALQYNILLD